MNDNVIDFGKCRNFKKYSSSGSGGSGNNTDCPYSTALESQISRIREQLIETKWLLGILITIFGLIVPILCSSHTMVIDKSFDKYNAEVNAKFEVISKQLEHQKELDKLQIQHDIDTRIRGK